MGTSSVQRWAELLDTTGHSAFLQSADLVLLHIHGTEHKVHHAGDLFHIGLGVHHHQLLSLGGDGGIHGPAACHGLLIGLPGGAGAGCQDGQLEPGVVLHQGDEALTHHAGGADDAYFVLLFHFQLPP